jgi:pimeloyl-ACP methyl ester carboxylesterase
MIDRQLISEVLSEGRQDLRQELLGGLPVTEQRLLLSGISTAVLQGGNGPPMVLLHGPGGYAAHFMRLIPKLTPHYRVVAPDLPGHGASDPGGALDGARVLAWLGELIDQTCSEPPTLVGQLVGGAIAARFAVDHGNRLARLVLVDSFGLSSFRPAPAFGAALNEFLADPTRESHDELWQLCARDLPSLRRGMGDAWQPFAAYNVARARTAVQKAALPELMRDFGLPAISPADLERITVPTSLIWGRHDLATPLAVAEAASQRYGWPLHVIEDANDDPPIEQPDALLRALFESTGAGSRDP